MARYGILLLLVGVVISWDLQNRLRIRMDVTKETQYSEIKSVHLPTTMNSDSKEKFLARFSSSQDDLSSSTDKVDSMGLEQQNSQSGSLDQLYSGSHRIRLVAVIRSSSATASLLEELAVVDVVDTVAKTGELIEVKRGEYLLGYKVQDVGLHSLSLLSQDGMERNVILPVYSN